MINAVLEIIKEKEKERELEHREPKMIPYVELKNTVYKRLNRALNELRRNNVIKIRQGANDKLIEVCHQEKK